MTAPVEDDDLVQGVVTYLLGKSDIGDVLGSYPDGTPYLFQHRLWTEMENSQSTAAVLMRDGGWTGPNQHNSLHFPRLTMDIWADPLRDAGNNVTDPGEVYRRINRAFKVIDRHLHRPQGGEQWWGEIRSIACIRMTEPSIYPVPDGDGLLRLVTSYGVTEG